MKIKLLALALASSVIAAPAMADVYVGLDYSTLTLTNLAAGSSQPEAGYRLVGGYNFTPVVALEVAYSMNGSAKNSAGQKFTPNTSQIAAVGTFPLSDAFAIIGKLGYASNSLTGDAVTGCTTCSKSGLMYGAGAQFNINKEVGIRVQYESLGDFTGYAAGSQIGGSAINLGVIFNL